MKKQLIVLMGSVTPFVIPMTAQAAQMTSNYSDLYVAGDSLADNGNLYRKFTGQTFPPEPFYYQGRFSNGPTFAELLAGKIGLTYDPDKNLALGGSGAGNFHPNPNLNGVVGLRQQIGELIGDDGKVDPNALYLISSGTNDYTYVDRSKPQTAPDFLPASVENVDTVIGNIGEALTRLSDAGARKFFVLGVADYSNLPLANTDGFATNPLYTHLQSPTALSSEELTALHNDKLQALLTDFSETPGINAKYFDLNGFLNDLLDDPASFGFTNTTEACFNSDIVDPDFTQPVCSNPDEYLFYDQTHPTAITHELLAEATAEAVPEPLTILGAGTAIGFGSLFKRKLAKADKKS